MKEVQVEPIQNLRDELAMLEGKKPDGDIWTETCTKTERCKELKAFTEGKSDPFANPESNPFVKGGGGGGGGSGGGGGGCAIL
jgi:hypothetical protein